MEREYEVIVEDEDYFGVDDEEEYDAYMSDIYYDDKTLGLI